MSSISSPSSLDFSSHSFIDIAFECFDASFEKVILIGRLNSFKKPAVIIQCGAMAKDTHFLNIDIFLILILENRQFFLLERSEGAGSRNKGDI